MKWYIMAFKKYGDILGRASRKEFWMFQLIHMTIIFCIGISEVIIFNDLDPKEPGPLLTIYFLLTIVPVIALMVRRIHDTGHSGWCFFTINIIPPLVFLMIKIITPYITNSFQEKLSVILSVTYYICSLWLFYLMIKRGDCGQNKYGENPAISPNPPPYP